MRDQKLSRRNRYAWLALAMIGLSFATWRTGASTFHLSTAPKLITAADLNKQTGVVADALPAIPSLFTEAIPQPLPSLMQQSAGCGASFSQAPGSPVSAGSFPFSLVAEDFNLDGKPDFAVTNVGSNNLTILLGNGDGIFTQPAGSPINVGSAPINVVAYDLNLDGKLDLVVANNESSNLTILLGDGNGSFTQAIGSPVSVAGSPQHLAIEDFNLDGKPDLAVPSFFSDNVAILLGNGNGGFTPTIDPPISAGDGPNAVSKGDFNLDGKPDLAVANVLSKNLTILLGNGLGAFTQAINSPVSVGIAPRSVKMRDFNLDGKPDLAVANGGSANVTILLGVGSGAFSEAAGSPIATGVNGQPLSMAIADFNFDGKVDLAVSNFNFNYVTVLQGNGNGGFSQTIGSPITVGNRPASLVAGDFNLDGKPDFATANYFSDNVTIQLNTCPAQPCSGIAFSQPAGSPIDVGNEPTSIAVGDFDLDGKFDVAVANYRSDNIMIFLGDGIRDFTQAPGSPVSTAGRFPRSLAISDLNLDGKADLAIVNHVSGNVTILLGNGLGGFSQAKGSPITVRNYPRFSAIEDFNLDGKPDLAVTNQGSNNLSILLGNGSGGFTESTESPVSVGNEPEFVLTKDFNLDGKADLAVTNYHSNNVTILLGDGSGTFTQAIGSPIALGSEPQSMAADDFNLDGIPDLAIAMDNVSNLIILLGNGKGGFTQGVGSLIGTGIGPFSLAVDDFNLDGKPDIAVANIASNNLTILLSNGSGGFIQATNSPISTGTYPISVISQDFNSDGKGDLAVANAGSNNLTILLNICTPYLPPIINCPSNITVGTGVGQNSASVPFSITVTGAPISAVTCRVGATVITSPHVFPVGTTTVTCTASNGVTPDASCSFTVTVNRVSGSVNDPLLCMGPRNKVQATLNISNDGQVNQNVTSNTTFTNLTGVLGSCVATPNIGTCTVTASAVSYSATLPPGTTATITYLTQVSDLAPPGAQVCTNNSVSFNGGQPTNFSVCDVVDCPAAGPGGVFPATAEASDQKAGSILIYNIYTSSTDPTRQNTRINITNTHLQLPTFVHLFFVAEGCAVADSYVCLTANQTASFLASDLDPGTTGYLVAVAVDALGCPTTFNHLIGDEYVKFASGHAANLGAEAFAALPGGLPACDQNASIATISFDGLSYNRAPASLALNSIGSRADGNDTLLIINRIGGNLGLGASTLGTLFGILYDDAENAISFSITGNCQIRNSLTNSFPRSTPRFETFVPAGRTGWLKVFNQTGAIGITGAAINFNPNATSSAGAFNQGHNLHHLTLNNQMSYIIPVFPPSC